LLDLKEATITPVPDSRSSHGMCLYPELADICGSDVIWNTCTVGHSNRKNGLAISGQILRWQSDRSLEEH
jgi:hypothetical protein